MRIRRVTDSCRPFDRWQARPARPPCCRRHGRWLLSRAQPTYLLFVPGCPLATRVQAAPIAVASAQGHGVSSAEITSSLPESSGSSSPASTQTHASVTPWCHQRPAHLAMMSVKRQSKHSPPAYLKVHTAFYHFLGNGKIRRFGCSLLFSGVARAVLVDCRRP